MIVKSPMKIKNLKSRRSFIKNMAGGALFSGIAIAGTGSVLTENRRFPGIRKSASQKPLKIGIIGGSVSAHTFDYGKLFNIDKKFPGAELLYAWADTDEFALAAKEKARIPNIVRYPQEMSGKIDALIINHRHPKYHLEPAIPFIKAGIPTFIDKPFCLHAAKGREFLELARSCGTSVSSWSTIAQSDKTADLKRQVESIGLINNIVSLGPTDIESPYGGVYFYGVHSVDPLLYIFGDKVTKVRVTVSGKSATGTLVFEDGMLATIIFMTQTWEKRLFAETKKGVVELKSDVQESDPPKYYADMVDMFRTGREHRSHESILHSIAVLEALDKSIRTGKWGKVKV